MGVVLGVLALGIALGAVSITLIVFALVREDFQRRYPWLR